VCNNTATSKLVYDFIAGFESENEDGSKILHNGRFEPFRNFDEYGNPYARPRTLLIDSRQLESGDALDDNFRSMAADEIERFRREIVERTGDVRQAENLLDADLLREVTNTVGKSGRLGSRFGVWFRSRCSPKDGTPIPSHTYWGPCIQHPIAVRAGHRPRLAASVL
jgi:type III restriction enzyme